MTDTPKPGAEPLSEEELDLLRAGRDIGAAGNKRAAATIAALKEQVANLELVNDAQFNEARVARAERDALQKEIEQWARWDTIRNNTIKELCEDKKALQKEVAELKRHGTDVYMAETVNAQDNIINAQEKRIKALERVLGDALESGLLHGPTAAHQKMLNAVRAALW